MFSSRRNVSGASRSHRSRLNGASFSQHLASLFEDSGEAGAVFSSSQRGSRGHPLKHLFEVGIQHLNGVRVHSHRLIAYRHINR